MTPDELRASYLEYFENRGHKVVPSSPVVPVGDPTLLFTNAGMNQFKDLLLGNEVRDYKRAASVQKCIRAGGKHNDLDEVGRDGRHLTFFEMLGNWSFGDYYKRDAIKWAWDYITDVLELDTARLYVTIYKDDDEAFDIWTKEVGVDPDRVLRLGDIEQGDEENFWSMGPTGPCGPCTEIHYDKHPEIGELEFVEGYDDERVVEFWNLVFMEFDRDEDGNLEPLPLKSVDTGMGLDRMATILAGTTNIFHTELFLPIIRKTLELAGESTDQDWDAFFSSERWPAFAVIADHARTVTFALVDGARFANEGRGSVLRSILRRAVRFGRQLGFTEPFLHEVSASVVEHFGHVYPDLRELGAQAGELIRLEEERFFRTLDRGIALFEEQADNHADEGQLPGAVVFELHATFGFPPDLTQVMAEERGMTIDWEGYKEHWAGHQAASKGSKDIRALGAAVGDWVNATDRLSSFVGYASDSAETRISKYRPLGDDRYEVILVETPFYAESGGQVGDTGTIRATDGSVVLEVEDTQKGPMGWVHTVRAVEGELTEAAAKGTFSAEVDASRRRLVESHHTATHLLHEALRHCVSDQIFQAGSLVAPDRLRFDFSHGQPLTEEELAEVERRVNDFVQAAHDVVIHEDVERDRAVNELGAMAIFGEKYGDSVRVVEIADSPSIELCGGTHVKNTRDIGVVRVTSESGVAAGIRRIEAIANRVALDSFADDSKLVAELARTLKTERGHLLDRAAALLEERAELEKRVDQLTQKLAAQDSGKIVDDAEDVDGVKVIAKRIEVRDRDQLLKYADSLRDKLEEGVALLAAEIDGKPALLCMVTDSAVANRKLKAGDLINQAASYVGGRGGGRPTLAQAGGSDVSGISAAVDNFGRIVREALQ